MAKNPDTIAAIATPPGQGGIGIVRLSGPMSLDIATQITGKVLAPRHAHYSGFYDGAGDLIDKGLALYFPAPHSYTGEESVEFHGHGGQLVLNRLLNAIIALGVQRARPGEFSERAFMHDKMDLIQVEAVADLINSASEQAARSAMRSMEGEFSKLLESLRRELIDIRALTEAALDFPDEEIDFLKDADVRQRAQRCLQRVQRILENAHAGRLLNEGIRIAIIGAPNVGKSSLLNRLIQKERAIVTDIPGTTRDLVEDTILIAGISTTLVDTAGIHDSWDRVESEGIKRSYAEMDEADIILFVDEINAAHDEQVIKRLEGKKYFRILNKIDLQNKSAFMQTDGELITIGLSAKTGEGIEGLLNALAEEVSVSNTGEGLFLARRRHVDALTEVKKHLVQSLENLDTGQAAELFAQDLYLAQTRLGEMTGIYTADDLLGEIFSRFCIGK